MTKRRNLLFAVLAMAGLSVSDAAAQAPQTQRIVVTARPAVARPGDLVVLTIRTPASTPLLSVRGFGRELLPYAVDATRSRVLVGVDLETTPGTHAVEIEAGEPPALERATHLVRVTARKFRTRRLTVDEAFVNPPASVMERIARETAELNTLWAAANPVKLWDGPFVRPVPEPANSAFGTRTVLNGQPRSPHSGADFSSDSGTPIKAPNAGKVVLAGDRYFTGNTVMIDHGLALFSLFAHLSETAVGVGDIVAAGDVIGKVGATGRVTGPHLHWSVRANGARIDPLSLLSVLGPARPRK